MVEDKVFECNTEYDTKMTEFIDLYTCAWDKISVRDTLKNYLHQAQDNLKADIGQDNLLFL